MTKDETLEALTQEIWGELPFGKWWTDATAAQQKDAVAETLRKSATLAQLLTGKAAIPSGQVAGLCNCRTVARPCTMGAHYADCPILSPAQPSGQVAEDAKIVETYAFELGSVMPYRKDVKAALSRLAAQAQSAETYRANWQEAERGRMALLAERDELKRQRDARELDLMLRFEADDGVLSALATERDWRQKAEAEANTLRRKLADAQGDVAANVEEAERLRLATGATLTVRDEFAKAAMQGIAARTSVSDDPGLIAVVSYQMADAMLKERAK